MARAEAGREYIIDDDASLSSAVVLQTRWHEWDARRRSMAPVDGAAAFLSKSGVSALIRLVG